MQGLLRPNKGSEVKQKGKKMFENNGTYNLFAMASAARVRPDAPRGYIVENHQPVGDCKDDEPIAGKVDLSKAAVGSFWKTRLDGRAELISNSHARVFKGIPQPYRIRYHAAVEDNVCVSGFSRTASDPCSLDLVGPWVD